MRLIEAGALKASVRAKYPALSDRCEINELVDAAPTIDAIPIDWLDAQIRGYASALKSTELKALLVVKRLWEKEQEVQDG